MGFSNAGIEIASAVDNWEKAVEIYRENFEHKCYLQDISEEEKVLQIIQKYNPEMIIGGSPCQDFCFATGRVSPVRRPPHTYRILVYNGPLGAWVVYIHAV